MQALTFIFTQAEKSVARSSLSLLLPVILGVSDGPLWVDLSRSWQAEIGQTRTFDLVRCRLWIQPLDATDWLLPHSYLHVFANHDRASIPSA